MTRNGRPWRIRVQLPPGYQDDAVDDTRELFVWLRDFLLPAIVAAPVRITLHLIPPGGDDDDRPVDETE